MFSQHLCQALPSALCQELLEFARRQTFQEAPVNNYGQMERLTSIRNNDRLEWDNASLAQRLETVLKEGMGADFPEVLAGRRYASTGTHFRIYRYRPGQFFKPHRDGSYQDADRESLVTVLFYLNDADGGETRLMPYGPREQWAYRDVPARAGDILLFEHRLWHEGRPVQSGEKYVLRTDLFYSLG